MKRFIGGQRRVVELAIADLTSPLEAGALRPEKPRSDNRIVILDSLRGAVALIIVAHHIWTIFNAEINERLSAPIVSVYDLVQAQNHRAVMAFFILSGFTIALTTQGRVPVNWAAARDYLGRRFRRIVPLFYFSLIWTAALGAIFGAGGQNFALRTLAGNLLFLQTSSAARGTWFVPYGGNGPYWSLSYEMVYYLALPLALTAAGGAMTEAGIAPIRMRLRLIALGLAAMLVGLAMLSYAPNPLALFAAAWIVWIAGFCAYGLERKPVSLLILALPALGAWTLVALLSVAGRRSDTLAGTSEGTLLALGFGVLATWQGWTAPKFITVLGCGFNGAFARVGRGSYALYLLHYPFLLAMHRLLIEGQAGLFGWAAAAVFFLGFVIEFCPLVERASTGIFRRRLKSDGRRA